MNIKPFIIFGFIIVLLVSINSANAKITIEETIEENIQIINDTRIFYETIDMNSFVWIETIKDGMAYICFNVSEKYSNEIVPLNIGDTTYYVAMENEIIGCNMYYIGIESVIQFGENSTIIFVDPTPESGSAVSVLYSDINITIEEYNLSNILFNWNGTNYTVYDDSLLLFLGFDNISSIGDNASLVKDLSMYGNDGFFKNGLTENSYTEGKYGNAMKFNTSISNIEIPYDAMFYGMAELTVSAWINVTNCIENAEILRPPTYILRITSDCKLETYTWANTNANELDSTDTFNTNEWVFVVMTYNGSLQTNYINGKISGTDPQSGTIDNFVDIIGVGAASGGAEPFNGSIDEIKVWNKSFTADEIQDMYERGLQKYDVGKWKMYINKTSSPGTHTYYACVNDTLGNMNCTDTRTIDFGGDATKPDITWVTPTDPNGATVTRNWTYLNTTISDFSNTSAFFDWNRTLRGYWSFDHYNSTVIFDNSTYNNFARFEGNIETANITTAKYGDGMNFNGVNDSLNITDSPSLRFDNNTNITMSAWIKTGDTAEAQMYIMSKNNDSTFYWMKLQGGQLSIGYQGDKGSLNANNGPDLRDNTWHHVVGIIDRSIENLTGYVDGVKSWTDLGGTRKGDINNDFPLVIGAFNDLGSLVAFFNGSIDEVQIFARDLSPEEILAMYNNGINRLNHNFSQLNNGNYTYQAYAIDSLGNLNITTERWVNISVSPCVENIVNTSIISVNTTFGYVDGTCNSSGFLDYRIWNWTEEQTWTQWDSSVCGDFANITWTNNISWGNYTYNVSCDFVGEQHCDVEPIMSFDEGDVEIEWMLDCQGINRTYVTNNIINETFDPQYIFSHTNETMPVTGVDTWTNISFAQEDSDIKKGITHTFNDETNHTFMITEDGIYSVNYNIDVEDTSASASNIDVATRMTYFNGSEVLGSVFETDVTKQGSEVELSHTFLMVAMAGDVFMFQFIAEDADIQISTHGTYGEHPESASIVMTKVDNL